MTATELLRNARDVIEELRRQIHQRCDSEGAEGDFDIYKAWPLRVLLRITLGQR